MSYREKVNKLYKYLFKRYRNIYLGFYIHPIKNESVMSFTPLYFANNEYYSGEVFYINKNKEKHGIEIEFYIKDE